jgi:iron complex outermembrane receptor protein
MQFHIFTTPQRSFLGRLLALCFAVSLVSVKAQVVDQLFSEQDYLREIPQVFSTSRLPQHPQDTSGANTSIDRSYIKASGARNLSELFVGIPGMQVSLNAGGRPVVAYHGFSGQVSQRMQVFVDGRSLYAPYMFGGVDWSSVTVPLDEIDRIEIHRGSNSAAYGANAFLGVIQIYTREAVQASGLSFQIQKGNNNISDRSFRWGRSSEDLQWRAVVNQKGDHGLSNRIDSYRKDSLDYRADFQKSSTESVMFLAGTNQGKFGIGIQNSIADPIRDETNSTSFAHLKFKKLVDDGQEWSLSASWTHDRGSDAYRIPIISGAELNILKNRQANRYSVEYQHYNSLSNTLRASWGGEYHRDQVQSFELFATEAPQKNAAWRMFYNQEWKPFDHWTFNAGGLLEEDRFSPQQFAPRFSVNWKPSTDHVLKVGYSSAFRTPSLFEQKSNWRIRDELGQTLYIKYLSRGGLVPEHVKAADLVYQGQWRPINLALDVRLFREELKRLISGELYTLHTQDKSNALAYDLRNNASATQQGVEYQISVKPFAGSTLAFSEYRARTLSAKPSIQLSVPQSSNSVVWMHQTESGFSFYSSYFKTKSMTWLGEDTSADDQKILALSLQKRFKLEQASINTSLTLRRSLGQFYEYRELQYLPRTLWLGVQIEH